MSLDRDHETPDARQDDGALPGSSTSPKAGLAVVGHPGTTDGVQPDTMTTTEVLGSNGAAAVVGNGVAADVLGAGGRALGPGGGPVSVDMLLSDLLAGLSGLCDGDFSVRLGYRDGLGGEVARRFDELAATQERHARELERVSNVIRRDGRLTQRMDDLGGRDGWRSITRSVNSLIDDLARPTHEVGRVIAAVAEGDLSQHMPLEI